MIYKKLVRDKIPEIIQKDNKIPVTHIASEEEYFIKLKEKLLEEVKEFIEASNEEEMADVLEVLNAIYDLKNWKEEEIENLRKKKAEERGAFKKKFILDEVKD